jgi:PAS domain S-box-containing protein
MTPVHGMPGAKPRLRLLIVEDVEDDAALLVGALSVAYDVQARRVETSTALREAIGSAEWDLLVTDFSLPRLTAMDTLRELKASGLDLPCIVYSGTIDEEAAVDALRAGARDFISKDRLARLLPAVSRELQETEERREKRRATEALGVARERMRFALETAGVGTWETTLETGQSTWSEMTERLHGQPPGGLGSTIEHLVASIDADDREQVHDHFRQAMQNRGQVRIEYRVTWPDRSSHWIAAIGKTIHDEAGRVVRAAGVALDITVQKNLEAQARHSQRLDSIGHLAGGIAHDFNNMLTAILGFGNLLIDDPFVRDAPDRFKRDLDQIRIAGERAALLTGQLLAFSRKQVLQPTVLSLNAIVTNLTPMLRRLIDADVALTMRLAADLGSTRADVGQLDQVLMNLVVNARDAMPDGGTITIDTANVELDEAYAREHLDLPGGSYVMMAVTDTGIGMSPEVQARIFEPFFTTKEPGRGTGLGLATIFGILTQHQGNIHVASEVGRGTMFSLYLPRCAGQSPAADTAPESPFVGNGETVLLVEDDHVVRRLTRRILTKTGYRVIESSHADEALRMASVHDGRINLLLTDIVLPGANGITLAHNLMTHCPGVKVLYMSGYGDAVVRHGLPDSGTAFLQKPFTFVTLNRAVWKALHG